jgi:predicted ATPase/class 3 adenylate cyclase
MDQAPSGTVTLLFTDVEGSTRLWEDEPKAMTAALRRHDEIIRAVIEDQSGFVFKTVGDAFCATFATPQAALSATLVAQRQLVSERWPTGRPIRVRMALHTGVCEERDNDYFGPAVNRTARLEAIAHGGQVVVSGTTADLLSGLLPEGVRLRDLGQHRLKDLGRPEQVFQLEAETLPSGFPPLASLDNPELPNNLPGLLSAFIGRDRELSEIGTLITSSRLVTLTGAGGCGKTRLALQAAAELLEGTAEGVWFVDLAPVTGAGQVLAAVAGVLGVQVQGGQPLPDALMAALREQAAILLLDNCEHVIDEAAEFCSRVVRSCPRVRILATSREPLGVDGERVYRVASLSLPPPDAQSAEDLAASDAARLFVDRARAQDPGFAPGDALAPLVASVCRRLDGIPLALELAAARLSSMSLTQLSDRLDQRFRLLTGGSRNVMPRQQTLQATVDWSFSLLSEPERETLRRLAVFAGGFELEAAEAVCATEQVDAFGVMDLISSLVDKSLVVADRTPASVRYRMLETIRQYCAQELLRAGGEAEVLRVRDEHAAFYVQLAQEATLALTGPRQGDWLRRLDLEWENCRAAVAHLEAEGRPADVLRLGVGLGRFAMSRGQTEVIAWLRRALGQAPPEPGARPASALTADALLVSSLLMQILLVKDLDARSAAREYAERGLTLAGELDDQRLTGAALCLLAGLAHFERDLARVRQLGEAGVEVARRIGDRHLLGTALSTLAFALPADDQRRLRLEALACFREAGDHLLTVAALHNMYGVGLHAGRLDEARAYLEEGIALAEELGAGLMLYVLSGELSIVLLIEGRAAEAAPLVRRNLLVARRIGAGVDVAMVIFAAACCAAWQGEHRTAARLHGAADADITAALADGSIAWSDLEQRVREDEQARLRQLMGEQAFGDAYRLGGELSRLQAVELALGRPGDPAGHTPATTGIGGTNID